MIKPEMSHNSTLTCNDVQNIRNAYKDTAKSQRDLAPKFEVNYYTANSIINKIAWVNSE